MRRNMPNMHSDISISSYAKWILSGEHAVVHGGEAIAFPMRKYSTQVSFSRPSQHVGMQFTISDSQYIENATGVMQSLFNVACDFLMVDVKIFDGSNVDIKSSIPIKIGLGSSAAICVCVAKVFESLKLCSNVFELSKKLENIFHKKSSGLDVAVVMHNKPIIFGNNRNIQTFNPLLLPNILISYCGERASTSQCAAVVGGIRAQYPKLAGEIDAIMGQSVEACKHGMCKGDNKSLVDGINLGFEAFNKWGLISPVLSRHIDMLKSLGAKAAKPIGSGLGGCVVSVWESQQIHEIQCDAIICYGE